MNKTLKKLTVATLACVALCGTTMAAPRHGGPRGPRPAPVHQVVHRHHHHGGHHHGDGLIPVLVGGIIGGIIGAIAG